MIKNNFFIPAAMLGFLFVSASLLFAETYSDRVFGINLTVQDYWEKLPKAELNKFLESEMKNGTFGKVLDVHRSMGWKINEPERIPAENIKKEMGRLIVVATESQIEGLEEVKDADALMEYGDQMHGFLEAGGWTVDGLSESDVRYRPGVISLYEAEFTMRNPLLKFEHQENPAEFKAYWAALKTEKGWYQMHYVNLADEFDHGIGGIKYLFHSAEPIKEVKVGFYMGWIFGGITILFLLLLARNILKEKNRTRTFKLTDTLPTEGDATKK